MSIQRIFSNEAHGSTTINIGTASLRYYVTPGTSSTVAGARRITTGDGSVIDFDAAKDVPMFLIGVNLQFQRNSSTFYGLTTSTRVKVNSAATGSLTCQAIVAKEEEQLTEFLEALAGGCPSGYVQFLLRPEGGCDRTNEGIITYWLGGVDMSAISLNIQAGQQGVAILNQTTLFTFDDLSMGNM